MFLKNIHLDLDWSSPMTITMFSLDSEEDNGRKMPVGKIIKEFIAEVCKEADIGDGAKILEDAAAEFERHARSLRRAAEKQQIADAAKLDADSQFR